MVRHSKKTLGYENIVLNLSDVVVIQMCVGDLRKIITDVATRTIEELPKFQEDCCPCNCKECKNATECHNGNNKPCCVAKGGEE